jgi:hypothetical protein
VSDLAEPIAVLGLLEPLVVDRRGRLLAGGHRKAAVFVLKEANPAAYAKHFSDDLVPVRVVDFDAEENPDLALQVEVTENEKRRDYTPVEVRALTERLRDAGYAEVKGRPAKGEKALRPGAGSDYWEEHSDGSALLEYSDRGKCDRCPAFWEGRQQYCCNVTASLTDGANPLAESLC